MEDDRYHLEGYFDVNEHMKNFVYCLVNVIFRDILGIKLIINVMQFYSMST